MLANRQTLEAGVVTDFIFTRFQSNYVLVKNETSGAVLFCDGLFDADEAASIPAFSWQAFNVSVLIGEPPIFTVKADVAGAVEVDFGSPCMGTLFGPAFNLAGMIPHTLSFVAGDDTTLTATLVRLHGETLDLDVPVLLVSGATVFTGDVIEFDATATEEGFYPVLTVNGEEVELTDGATTITITGETTATTVAVEEEGEGEE